MIWQEKNNLWLLNDIEVRDWEDNSYKYTFTDADADAYAYAFAYAYA